MPTLRVFQVAKLLKVDSEEILDALSDMGISVTSNLAQLDEDVVSELKELFKPKPQTAAKPAAAPAAPDAAAPAPAQAAGAKAPEKKVAAAPARKAPAAKAIAEAKAEKEKKVAARKKFAKAPAEEAPATTGFPRRGNAGRVPARGTRRAVPFLRRRRFSRSPPSPPPRP